jgi:hydroxymethylglutaryl-CoA synthase
LENALDWIWSGRSNGNCRIVCGTDIARYGLHTAGEHTQGASAAAVLVESEPRLLEFDKIVGQYTKDEGSFYRPHFSDVAFANEETEKAYLNAMREAYVHYREQAVPALFDLKEGEALTDRFDLLSFHQPYPAMTKKGLASLLIHEYRGLPRWAMVVKEIGEGEPKIENFTDKGKFESQHDLFRKKFVETKTFQDVFQAKMADGQEASIEEGNSYTASIWNHLVSLLTLKDKKGERLEGKRGSLGFFGSGSTASGQSYTVVPGCENVVRSFNLMSKLKNRVAISLKDYEDLHEHRPLSDGREFVLPPQNEFVLTKIDNGYRYYDFAD